MTKITLDKGYATTVIDGGVTTITFPALDHKTSKEQEKQVLLAMQAACPAGSYLNSLFSDTLITWVCQRIKDDVSTDLMQHLAFTVKTLQDEQKRLVQEKIDVEHLRLLHQVGAEELVRMLKQEETYYNVAQGEINRMKRQTALDVDLISLYRDLLDEIKTVCGRAWFAAGTLDGFLIQLREMIGRWELILRERVQNESSNQS